MSRRRATLEIHRLEPSVHLPAPERSKEPILRSAFERVQFRSSSERVTVIHAASSGLRSSFDRPREKRSCKFRLTKVKSTESVRVDAERSRWDPRWNSTARGSARCCKHSERNRFSSVRQFHRRCYDRDDNRERAINREDRWRRQPRRDKSSLMDLRRDLDWLIY